MVIGLGTLNPPPISAGVSRSSFTRLVDRKKLPEASDDSGLSLLRLYIEGPWSLALGVLIPPPRSWLLSRVRASLD